MANTISLSILWVALLFSQGETVFSNDAEMALLKKLFHKSSYDKRARPVQHSNQSVTVNIQIVLRQLVEINEKAEFIDLAAWSRQRWRDPKMSWDPNLYENISKINVPSDLLWLPDITLYNNAHDDVEFGGNLDKLQTRITLKHTGDIMWLAPIILKATCKIRIKHFPFDTQHCAFKFGSWTYTMAELNVTGLDLDTTYYETSQEWKLFQYEKIRNEVSYTCCPDDVFPDVTYHLYFQRRSLYYVVNLVFPIALITLLTIMTFILHANGGERLSVAITLMLDITVFLLVVNDLIPQSSEDVCLVSVFFVYCIILIFFMLIALFSVSKFYNRTKGTLPMPFWVRKHILDQLAYVVRTRHDKVPGIAYDKDGGNASAAFGAMMESVPNQAVAATTSQTTRTTMVGDKTSKKITSSTWVKEKMNEEEEWNLVAITLDRVLFFSFFLAFIVGIIGCFATVTYVD